jgi:hypothetical protein
VDLGFALALIVAGGIAATTWTRDPRPDMPAGVCLDDDFTLARPQQVAVLIGQLEPGDPAHDPAMQSIRFLEQALVARGFRRTGSRFTRDPISVDVIGPPSLPFEDVRATGAAIDHALREHLLVYYNGHSYDGALRFSVPADRVLVLDACWSAQPAARRLGRRDCTSHAPGRIEMCSTIDGEPLAGERTALARLHRGFISFRRAAWPVCRLRDARRPTTIE